MTIEPLRLMNCASDSSQIERLNPPKASLKLRATARIMKQKYAHHQEAYKHGSANESVDNAGF